MFHLLHFSFYVILSEGKRTELVIAMNDCFQGNVIHQVSWLRVGYRIKIKGDSFLSLEIPNSLHNKGGKWTSKEYYNTCGQLGKRKNISRGNISCKKKDVVKMQRTWALIYGLA